MKNIKYIIGGIIAVSIILIVLYFIPIRSFEEIKYLPPYIVDGGPVYKVYYNIYNIKIHEEPKH